MGDFTVIKLVNARLRQLLFDGMTGEAGQYFNELDDIYVGSPRETAELQTKSLSVFLYQITEDPYLKNRPPVRGNGASRLSMPPMALRFHYMITPFLADPDANALDYHWWHYAEPGSYSGTLELQGQNTPELSFVIPVVTEPRTLHVVLAVTDHGEPRLTSYRRVVFTVLPSSLH